MANGKKKQVAIAAKQTKPKKQKSSSKKHKVKPNPLPGKSNTLQMVNKPQKHRPALPKGHVLMAASYSSAIARSVALPLSYSARVPDPWNDREVAIANPFGVDLVDSSTPAPSKDQWSGGGMFCGVSRDPLRFTMRTWSNTSLATWAYRYYFTSTDSTASNFWSIGNRLYLPGGGSAEDVALCLAPNYMGYVSGPYAYGPKQYGCHDNLNDPENTYLWLDAKTGATTELSVGIYDVAAGGSLPVVTFPSLAMTLTLAGATAPAYSASFESGAFAKIVITKSGYYTLKLTGNMGVGSTIGWYVQVDVVGSSSTIQWLPVPGLDVRAAEISALRMVGTSYMISPSSTALSEGGTIVGLQTVETVSPTSYLPFDQSATPTMGLTSQLIGQRHATSLNFKDGMYGWHKPTSVRCFDYQEPFIYNSAQESVGASLITGGDRQVVGYRSNMYPPGGWMVIAFQAAKNPLGGTDFPGAVARLTYSVATNIDTNSIWYSVALPNRGITMEEVMVCLKDVPQFTENPFHWSDITNWISRNANVLKVVAKAGITALTGAVMPEALPAVEAVNALW